MKVDPNRIPIVFGITGHRNLREQDTETLKKQIRKVFEETIDKCPNTPLMLLTPLAEGADRLAAEVALELGDIEIIAVLPMPKEELIKDNEAQSSIDEFERLLGKADRCIELPLVERNTMENIRLKGINRDRQYEQAGVYIARHSQVLIALWDGVINNSIGGTSQIVKYKRVGEPEFYVQEKLRPLEAQENGPVYHILTPRKSNPEPLGEIFSRKTLYPENHKTIAENETIQEDLLTRINIYNKDVVSHFKKLEDNIEESKGWLLKKEELSAFSDDIIEVFNHFAIADNLATYFKKKRERSLIALIILTLVAVLFLVSYQNTNNVALLFLYPTTLVVALQYYFIVNRCNYQNKHQDYRALAEGLRVQLFWDLADLNKDASKYYLNKHKKELGWIRQAIRVINIPKNNFAKMTQNKLAMLNLVKERWIIEEAQYFMKASAEYSSLLKKSGKFINALLKTVFWLIIVVLALHFKPLDQYKGVLLAGIFVLLKVLPAFAGAVGTYTTKMAFKELSCKYTSMGELFQVAGDVLNDCISNHDIEKAQELIFDLGKEALIENGDWVLLSNDKEIDRPVKL